MRIRLKNKEYFWVKFTNRIIEKTSNNEPKHILGIIQDINESKTNQDEIINYNNFINNVLELSPMLITIFDSFDNSISYLNKKFLDETFYSVEDINSNDHGFLSLILEEDIYNISKAIQNLVKDKSQEQTVNYRIKNKNSNILWLESTLNIFNLNSKRVDIICVSVDITKRVENEQKIRDLEKRWEFALEGSGDGVWDWNAITNKVFFSRQWKSMLGYEENEIGDSLEEWDKRVHPDDKEEVYEKLNAHFDGKTEIYMSQHIVLTKDGTYKWIFDRGKIIERDDENKPLWVIVTHTDISQLIETQEKLKESENRLKYIIDAAGEYIWESDLQNRYTFVSDRFTKILGYSQKEVIGKTPYDFMPDVEKKITRTIFFGEKG